MQGREVTRIISWRCTTSGQSILGLLKLLSLMWSQTDAAAGSISVHVDSSLVKSLLRLRSQLHGLLWQTFLTSFISITMRVSFALAGVASSGICNMERARTIVTLITACFDTSQFGGIAVVSQ